VRTAVEWAALALVAMALFVADLKHLATGHYNAFLSLLLGLVIALILFLKLWHRPAEEESGSLKRTKASGGT